MIGKSGNYFASINLSRRSSGVKVVRPLFIRAVINSGSLVSRIVNAGWHFVSNQMGVPAGGIVSPIRRNGGFVSPARRGSFGPG